MVLFLKLREFQCELQKMAFFPLPLIIPLSPTTIEKFKALARFVKRASKNFE